MSHTCNCYAAGRRLASARSCLRGVADLGGSCTGPLWKKGLSSGRWCVRGVAHSRLRRFRLVTNVIWGRWGRGLGGPEPVTTRRVRSTRNESWSGVLLLLSLLFFSRRSTCPALAREGFGSYTASGPGMDFWSRAPLLLSLPISVSRSRDWTSAASWNSGTQTSPSTT